MSARRLAVKQNLAILAKAIYAAIVVLILCRFYFVDTVNRGIIAGMSLFWLGFPLSLFWTGFIVIPLMIFEWASGELGWKFAWPAALEMALAWGICAVNAWAGYRQWFTLFPRLITLAIGLARSARGRWPTARAWLERNMEDGVKKTQETLLKEMFTKSFDERYAEAPRSEKIAYWISVGVMAVIMAMIWLST